MNEEDTGRFHYAVGLLMGLHSKYGDVNVLIYHDSIRVKIEYIGREMIEEDL